MSILIVTAVEQEAEAVSGLPEVHVVAGGVGRSNAAAATTQALIENGPFELVMSCGIAGALPESSLETGDVLLASCCIYAEEGIVTPDGFDTMQRLGIALGDFEGNVVPVAEYAMQALEGLFEEGPIATVATCSGTDHQAALIAARTGAKAEAMEGAAVVHAARRMGVPGIEIRSISNQTGDREGQEWNIPAALESLRVAVPRVVETLISA